MRHFSALIAFALLMSGCFKFDQRERTDKDTGGAKAVDADSEGVVNSQYDAQQKSAFEISAANAGAISGAGISIPPGALSIDTNISMQEGGAVVTDASAQDLGLEGVAAAGPAVLFGADDPTAKLSGNVAITLPLGDQGALRLAACTAYTVIYRLKGADGQTTSGAFATDTLTVSETSVKFEAPGFGVFQPACVAKAVAAAISKVSTDPILTKKQEQALAPVVYAIGEPTLDSAARAYSITISATGFAGEAKCFATIAQDKNAPADKVVALTVGQPLKVAALNDQAHSVFVRASCYEASNGRSSLSEWSKELAFTAKPANQPPEASVTITSPAANRLYNANDFESVIVAGTCSPSGSTVTILVGTTTSTVTCGTLIYSKTITLAGVADGDAVTLTVKPQGGAASSAKTVVVKKHATVPTKPVLTDGGVATNVKPSFTWTAIAGLTYEIDVGTTSNVATPDVDHAASLTASPHQVAGTPANGTMYARIRASDAWGNVSEWSNPTDGIEYDTVVPAVPTLSVSPAGPVTDDTTPTFTWSNSGTGVIYDLKFGSTAGADDLGDFPDFAGLSKTYTSTATNGSFVYAKVRAKDAAGNVSAFSTPVGIQFDTTDPFFNTTTVGASATIPGAVEISFDVGNDYASAALVKVVRAPGLVAPANCSSGLVVGTQSNPTPGQPYDVTDKIGGMSSTKYSYRLCLTDSLGRTVSQVWDGASATSPKGNPGPGCKRPPCDLPVGGATIGTSAVSPVTATTYDDLSSVLLGDLDNDTDLDAVGGYSSAHEPEVLTNTLVPLTTFNMLLQADPLSNNTISDSTHLALADFDGDNDLDLVAGGNLWKGAAGTTFATPSAGDLASPPIMECVAAVAVGDLDGDGNLDLFCGANKIYRGNGNGTFQAVQTLGDNSVTADLATTGGAAIGDLNGDGKLDVVIAKRSGAPLRSRVFLNNGGAFSSWVSNDLGMVDFQANGVKLGDVNKDGHLDAVLFTVAGARLFLGTSNGSFSAVVPISVSSVVATSGGVLGEFHADGKVGVLHFGYESPNDNGFVSRFVTSAFPGTDKLSSYLYSISGGDAGDLNGDGKLDFIISSAAQGEFAWFTP